MIFGSESDHCRMHHGMVRRFRYFEELGFDITGTGDHFVDWTNPRNPHFELWTLTSACAAKTTSIRIGTWVTQIPFSNPALLARQALTVDHISNGRLELGLGTGVTFDPSCEMMGIPNWSPRERVARFREYVEIVDRLLSNEVTTYEERAREYVYADPGHCSVESVHQPQQVRVNVKRTQI